MKTPTSHFKGIGMVQLKGIDSFNQWLLHLRLGHPQFLLVRLPDGLQKASEKWSLQKTIESEVFGTFLVLPYKLFGEASQYQPSRMTNKILSQHLYLTGWRCARHWQRERSSPTCHHESLPEKTYAKSRVSHGVPTWQSCVARDPYLLMQIPAELPPGQVR